MSLKLSVTVVRWTSRDKYLELARGSESRWDLPCDHVLGQVPPCGSRGPVWELIVSGIQRRLQASSVRVLEPSFKAPRYAVSLPWGHILLFILIQQIFK